MSGTENKPENGGGRKRGSVWAVLHVAVVLYSLNTVFAKMAGSAVPFSPAFFGWLLAEVMMLGLYAILWQQAIRHIELGVAYANKAIGLFWALLWSVALFRDAVTLPKAAGIALAVCGTLLMNLPARTEKPANAGEGGSV